MKKIYKYKPLNWAFCLMISLSLVFSSIAPAAAFALDNQVYAATLQEDIDTVAQLEGADSHESAERSANNGYARQISEESEDDFSELLIPYSDNLPTVSVFSREMQYALDLLERHTYFSELSAQDMAILCAALEINRSAMEELQSAGLSLGNSILYAQLAYKHSFDVNDLMTAYPTLEGCQHLETEMNKLHNFINVAYDEIVFDQLRQLIFEGYTAYQVGNAYAIHNNTGIAMSNLLTPAVKGTESDGLPDQEVQDLAIYADAIGVNSQPILVYAANQGYDDVTMIQKITTYISYQAMGITEEEDNLTETAEAALPNGTNVMSAASLPTYPTNIDEIRASQVVAPFIYDADGAEQISLNTGSLSHTVEDVRIPGVNGLDLVIARRYDSSEANVYNPGLYMMNIYSEVSRYYAIYFHFIAFWYEAYYSYNGNELRLPEYDDPVLNVMVSGATEANRIVNEMASEKQYPFGDGTIIFRLNWRNYFNCAAPPVSGYFIGNDWVDVGHAIFTYPTYKNNTYYNDLYGLGHGWSFAFSSIQTVDKTKYLHLGDGATYEIESTLTNDSSNLKDYSRTDMRIMAENGGYTSATHTLYYKDGKKEHFDKDGKLIAIRDRFNNTISFTHTKENDLPKITIVDTLNRTVVISGRKNDADHIMTVQTPEGNYEYTVEKIPEHFGNNINAYALASVKNPLNQTTAYGYSIDRTCFNMFQQQVYHSPRDAVSTCYNYLDLGRYYYNDLLFANAGKNYSFNLNEITYPTGLKTIYTYEKYLENLLQVGVQEVYRVSSRADTVGSDVYHKKIYSFPVYSESGSTGATGYPAYINGLNPQALPESYTYTASFEDEGTGLTTNVIFNNKHLLISSEEQLNEARTKTQTISYDSNKLPQETDTRVYNGADYLRTVEAYQYDNKGNVTASWSPLANGNTANTEYKTSYTYDYTYSLPLTKTYKQDANTTITERNTVNGANIIRQETLVNNVAKSKTEYDYDSFGNIKAIKKYKDDLSAYEQTNYDYKDNAYLSEIKNTGIINSEGGMATGTPGQATGTIVSKLEYDGMGRLTKLIDANNLPTSYDYNALGHITKQTNPDTTTVEYNRNYTQNTLTVKDENGAQIRYNYTPFGQEYEVRDVQTNALLSSKTYDDLYQLATETDVLNGATTTYIYDHDSRVTSKTTRNSANAILAQETYVYDDAYSSGAFQRIQKTVVGESNAPNIVTTQYTDNMGQVVQEGRILNGTEHTDYYTYDYIGNKTQECLAYAVQKGLAYSAKWEYDHAGHVTKAYNADGGYITNTYNTLGQLTSATDLVGTATTYTYDGIGRLLEEKGIIEENGATVYNSFKRYDYDPAGNISSTRVSNNQVGSATTWARTDYDYNNRNRLEFVTQYNGATVDSVTKYTYDGVGNTLTMRTGMSSKTAGGQQTTYTYDRLGRILTQTNPLNQQETYNYKNNGLGLLNTKTDRNGNVSTFNYDALGRLLSQQVRTPENVTETNSYTYYLTGAKKTETNPTISTTFVYDSLGRLAQETDVSDGVSTAKQYTYDIANNRLNFTATAGGTPVHNTAYTYDNQNRLKTVSDNSSLKATYNYNANGARESLLYANGTSEHYTYNKANWLTRLENRSGSTIVSSYNYTYFTDGNQRTKTDHTNRTTTYAYDGVGRLAAENESTGFGASYAYDRFGNRSTMTVTGAQAYTVAYSYDANNRLTQDVKTMNGAVTIGMYIYDPNGNQLAKVSETLTPATGAAAQIGIDASGVELYDYDGFNRMTRSNVNGVETDYTYRADGLRNSKETSTGKTTHLWDGANIAADLNGSTVVARYVRGINLLMSDSAEGQEFYLYNGHGDVVQLANASGAVVQDYDFDAFGVERNPDTSDMNPFRYCAEYLDSETGSIYLRTRYYSPVLGRFRAADIHWNPCNMIYGNNPLKWNEHEPYVNDPLGLNNYTYKPDITAIMQSGNLYAYAMNNPVMYIDPTGEFVGAIVGGAIGFIGGAIGGGISAAIKGEDIGNGMLSGGIGGAIGGAIVGAFTVDLFIAPGTSIVSAAFIGLAAGAVGGATSSMISQSTNYYFNNNTMMGFNMSWREVAISSATSAIFSGVGSGFGQSQVIFYNGEMVVGVVVGSFFAIGNSLADIANGIIIALYSLN